MRSAGTDRGSPFVVRLPLAIRPAAATAVTADPGRLPPPQLPSARVLVVDDNRDHLNTIIDALKQEGLEAFGASTSTEALDLAGQLHPEVAVLDLGLPEMDGFDLARALRSRSNAPPLRLIALSGYGREQDMAAAREAGFDAFFAKPVELPTLLGELRPQPN